MHETLSYLGEPDSSSGQATKHTPVESEPAVRQITIALERVTHMPAQESLFDCLLCEIMRQLEMKLMGDRKDKQGYPDFKQEAHLALFRLHLHIRKHKPAVQFIVTGTERFKPVDKLYYSLLRLMCKEIIHSG